MFELDDDEIFNAGMLEEYVSKMIAAGKRNVALDVSSVDCIYSDCINTLTTLNGVAANAGGCIAIVNPRQKTAEIIRNAGIHTTLKVFNSDADLLAGSGWIKGAGAQTFAKSAAPQTSAPPPAAPIPEAKPKPAQTPPPPPPVLKTTPAFVPPPKPPKPPKLPRYGAASRRKFLSTKMTIIIIALALVVGGLCALFAFNPAAERYARAAIVRAGDAAGGVMRSLRKQGSPSPRDGANERPSFPAPSESADRDFDDDMSGYIPPLDALDGGI